MSTNETPEEIANRMSQPGTFNLIERLQNRNLPEEDVDVYLDERAGWELVRLEEEHINTKNNARAVALEAKLKTVREKLSESRYVFTVRGMTNERYDEILAETNETHPEQFEESTNPLTGQKTKVSAEDPDRDALFNTLFLAESIAKVTDPDGNVDDSITPESVEFIKRLAPLDAIRRITELAFKMRLAVEWMDHVQDEDFALRP